MRTITIALLALGSALAAATPAAAQYYSNPYGYSADTSSLHRRIYNVLRSLDGVRPDQRYQLRAEAIGLDRQLRFSERNGLDPYRAHEFDVRIGQLEQRMQWAGSYNKEYYGDRDRERGHGRWRREHNGDDGDDGD